MSSLMTAWLRSLLILRSVALLCFCAPALCALLGCKGEPVSSAKSVNVSHRNFSLPGQGPSHALLTGTSESRPGMSGPVHAGTNDYHTCR